MSAETVFIFQSETRSKDQTRFRVVSKEPISEEQAFKAFRRWAEMHIREKIHTGKIVDIPYEKWRTIKS